MGEDTEGMHEVCVGMKRDAGAIAATDVNILQVGYRLIRHPTPTPSIQSRKAMVLNTDFYLII